MAHPNGEASPQAPRPRRLNSRKEIEAWLAERSRVLTELQRQERLERERLTALFDIHSERAA
jgi:hypothetical protein